MSDLPDDIVVRSETTEAAPATAPAEEPTQRLKDLATKPKNAAADAREQAKFYESVFAPTTLTFDDGSTLDIPPHPNLRMFDDDAQAEYERYEFELESCERHPDIEVPEQKIYDQKTGNLVTTLPATVQRGALKVPHRKKVNGQEVLLDPPYSVRVVQIALGDEGYAKLRAGTVDGKRGSAAMVWKIWNEQGAALAERQRQDPKSAGGAVDRPAVPEADPA